MALWESSLHGTGVQTGLQSFLNYPRSYFKDKKAVYVDAVHGSMLMISAQAFEETGGYDEESSSIRKRQF